MVRHMKRVCLKHTPWQHQILRSHSVLQKAQSILVCVESLLQVIFLPLRLAPLTLDPELHP
jgi:hypothetical protein